jgi:hypothetical protein
VCSFGHCIFSPSIYDLVANFDDNTLSLDEAKLKDYDANGEAVSRYGKAYCPVGDICHSCLPIDESSQMYYIPGDLILLATFPIHNKGTNALDHWLPQLYQVLVYFLMTQLDQ